MKTKQWASWLLAGIMALGHSPLPVTATGLTAAPPATQTGTTVPETTKSVEAAEAAAAPVVLTRDTAWMEVRALHAIRNAVLDEQEALEDWKNAVLLAEQLDPDKMVVENPFTGEDMELFFNDTLRMRLNQQITVNPQSMEFQYQTKAKITKVTTATLENTMNSLLLGLHAAQNEVVSKERAVKLAEQTLTRTRASFAAGRVVQLDVDTDALALKKAEATLRAAERSRENMARNYNRFVGKPLDRDVRVRLKPQGTLPEGEVDDFVLKALENRMEIFIERGTIAIQEAQAESMTYLNVHVNDADVVLEYARTLLSAEQGKVKLTDAQRKITAEIRAAHLRLRMSELDVVNTRETLARQQAKLVTVQSNIAAGRLPAYADDALVAAIEDIKAGIVTAQLSLDADVRKFLLATTEGPGL